MSIAPNPYATPKAVVADSGAGSPAEAVRQEHIVPEASIKSAGTLFLLGGVLASSVALSVLVSGAAGAVESLGVLAIGVMLAFVSASSVVVGWGMRTLRAWARTPAIVLAAIGLLGIAIGTLLNWCVLSMRALRKEG